MRAFSNYAVVCGVAALLGVALVGIGAGAGAAPAAAPARIPEAREVSQAFVAVAERLAPSVVRITSRQRPAASQPQQTGRGINPFEGTPFEDFFEDFGQVPGQPPTPRRGMGSGVVIDGQGHILTNHHVVADSSELTVTFIDGSERPGRVVGVDPRTDLAVVKVDGAKVKPAQFGDAEGLRVGEWVIAIGNPFGLDHSVTVGVLSAKGRYGLAPGKVEDFLQTDASINPGNSGGPLVNLSGEVVGINTMIVGLGTGVGFAVSESIARPIARQLIEKGRVTRPYIGIVMQTLTQDLRATLGPGAPQKGTIVSEVQRGSPAERAGLKVGDIVLAVGGTATADSREVQRAVLEHQVGEQLAIKLFRDGKELTLSVKAAELPDSTAVGGAGDLPEDGGQTGLSLQTLTPEGAARLNLERSSTGAVVTAVRPNSPAAEAGLRAGDVITRVDNKPVATAEQASRALGQTRKGGHLVRVQRGEGALFIAIPAPPGTR